MHFMPTNDLTVGPWTQLQTIYVRKVWLCASLYCNGLVSQCRIWLIVACCSCYPSISLNNLLVFVHEVDHSCINILSQITFCCLLDRSTRLPLPCHLLSRGRSLLFVVILLPPLNEFVFRSQNYASPIYLCDKQRHSEWISS